MTTVNRDEFETVKELLASAARYAESANERIDHTQQQLDQLGVKVDALTTAQDRTQQQLDALALSQREASDRTQQHLDTFAANQIEERNKRLELREDLEILFETVKQTDRTVARLGDRMDTLTDKVDALAIAQDQTRLQLGQLAVTQDQRFEQLNVTIYGLAEQLEQQAQQAEQDRNQAAIDRSEFRSTVTQLLQVLTQQMNGNGRTEG